jgi:hypothetical protein
MLFGVPLAGSIGICRRPPKLLTARGLREAQLGTDLAQRPTPGVEVGCTLNVHSATVTIKRWHRGPLLGSFAQPPQHIRQIRR